MKEVDSTQARGGRRRISAESSGLKFTRKYLSTALGSVCGNGESIESDVLLSMQSVRTSCG